MLIHCLSADYERHFLETRIVGAEIPDEPLVGSDSSDESDYWDSTYEDDTVNDHADNDGDGSEGSTPDSDSESAAGTDEPEQGGLMGFPQTPYPDTPVSQPCCNGHLDGVDLLGDDGVFVTNAQRYATTRSLLQIIY
jgi:hypothetical protein